MKMKSLSVGFLFVALVISGGVSAQQRKKTTRKTTNPPASSSGYGSSGYGTTPTQQQPTQNSAYGNNNQQQQTNQPQANIPIVVVKSTGNAALDTVPPSLRNDIHAQPHEGTVFILSNRAFKQEHVYRIGYTSGS